MTKKEAEGILCYIEDDAFVAWVRSGFLPGNSVYNDLRHDVKHAESIEKAISIIEALNFKLPTLKHERKRLLLKRIYKSIDGAS